MSFNVLDNWFLLFILLFDFTPQVREFKRFCLFLFWKFLNLLLEFLFLFIERFYFLRFFMALSFKKLDSLRIDFLVERELLEFFVSFSDEVFFLEELFLDDLEFILHLDHVFLFFLEGVEMFLELFQFEVPSFIAFFKLLQLLSEVKYLIFDSKLFLV